jgi:hypothetical protein
MIGVQLVLPLKCTIVKLIKYTVLFFVLAIISMGCKKEAVYHKNPIDLEPLAYLPDSLLCTATKEVPGLGAIKWIANCEAQIVNNTLDVFVKTMADTIDKGIRERLSIGSIPSKKGRYYLKVWNADAIPIVIHPFSTYARLLDDGDVSDGFWETDDSESNFIEITKIDLEKRVVEGTFDVYFLVKTPGSHGTRYSEQINFKSGAFRARIKE